MSSRRQDVPQGTYDNQTTRRRETYDHRGNVIQSCGIVWLEQNRKPAFGTYPDVTPFPWKK